jgi:hypothetical protein
VGEPIATMIGSQPAIRAAINPASPTLAGSVHRDRLSRGGLHHIRRGTGSGLQAAAEGTQHFRHLKPACAGTH